MIIGILFLLFGLSILIKIFFKIDIPVFRTFFALFLIYWGVRMLFGIFPGPRLNHPWVTWRSEDSVVFGEHDFKLGPEARGRSEFNVVFGHGTVDLTQAKLEKEDLRVEINSVFGETRVIIDPSMPIRIKATAAFGQARLPDRGSVAFGSLSYRSKDLKDVPGILRIEGNAVFGSLRFVTAQEETRKAAAGPSQRDRDDDDE